jgi:hypothetical protein
MLTKQEINEVFINTHLEDEYNFLQEDLVKLATAFIDRAKPLIEKAERDACIDVAMAYNTKVAEKIEEVRSKK